jgi:hypothetical protein
MQEKINPFEEKINQFVSEIEKYLLTDVINTTAPHIALDYHTKLSSYMSSIMGLIEKLDILEAEYFVNNRNSEDSFGDKVFKSDNACKKHWEITNEGIRQKFWENRIKRLKILSDTLEKVYYHGREEHKSKELK